MREIKFKAWDKIKKGWYTDFLIVDISFDHARYFEQGKGYLDLNGKEVAEKFDFMQYTGLHDKNGKDIFFGDILQTTSDDPETDMWKAEDWGYTVCEEDPEELGVTFSNWYPTTEEESVFNWKYVEIIGNLYENPELTKE